AAEQRSRAQQKYRIQRQEFRATANDLQLLLIRRLQKTIIANDYLSVSFLRQGFYIIRPCVHGVHGGQASKLQPIIQKQIILHSLPDYSQDQLEDLSLINNPYLLMAYIKYGQGFYGNLQPWPPWTPWTHGQMNQFLHSASTSHQSYLSTIANQTYSFISTVMAYIYEVKFEGLVKNYQ
ncbi:MAG: hypothetical protein EZS28_045932, partial [Streblomastix strix]